MAMKHVRKKEDRERERERERERSVSPNRQEHSER
jgi:hypothetical protein